jgi:hypothetical protein
MFILQWTLLFSYFESKDIAKGYKVRNNESFLINFILIKNTKLSLFGFYFKYIDPHIFLIIN